jgi:hypothetical protein
VRAEPTPSPPASRGAATATSLGIGLLLGLTASGGIAGERVTRGMLSVGMIASVSATLAALVAAVVTTRYTLRACAASGGDDGLQPFALVVLQGLGAVAGIALVHLVLRREAMAALPWLSERPPQFVNDIVAVFGLLALVWACARGLDPRLLVLALAGVTLYRLTSSMWHVDHAADGFAFTVQELVVAQLVAVAIGLGVFRAAAGDG